VVKATIDADETMESEPGQGAGVFIEYATGGRWHVYTMCDTDITEQSCAFDVVVTMTDGSITDVRGDALESADDLEEDGDGFQFSTVTSGDVDGVLFDATAGGTVRFEVFLDGVRDPRFVFWVGGGAIHNGAPTNPIDLVPSDP
jgi:hypothetical protein